MDRGGPAPSGCGLNCLVARKERLGALKFYSKDFNITGGGLMEMFLGMEIEQSNRSIKMHLDHYTSEMLNEYKAYIRVKKSLRPKRVPFSPGVILRPEDSPTLQDPSKQKLYRSYVATLQFAASWIRFDISFAVSQLAR
jgi:hypothetical protein